MSGPRPIWKGVLQLALVRIPIKVFAATEASEAIAFNQLHDVCQSRIQQKKTCPTCAREVKADEIVKGYEFEAGKYVILRPEELDAIAPPSTRVIDLVQVAEASALERRAIDRAYFLLPDGADAGPAHIAYAVLRIALGGRVGLGKLAIYGREYLIAVEAATTGFMLYTLHHAAELRAAPPLIPFTMTNVSPDINLARQVLTALQGPLDLADFTDQVQVDLRRLIAAKIAGEEIVIPPIPETPAVGNLRDALEQSLLAVVATKKTPAKATTSAEKKKAS